MSTSRPPHPHPNDMDFRGHNHVSTKHSRVALLAVSAMWYFGLLAACVSIVACIRYDGVLGSDAHAYWLAARDGPTYDKSPGEKDAYLYSPIFLVLVTPIALLPWHWFLVSWILVESIILAWLVKPLPVRWAIPTFLFFFPELIIGNINLMLAAAAVLGMRFSPAWTFPILTKVTSGVGLLWFAFRREWNPFLIGVFGTLAMAGMSYILNPGAWYEWFLFLWGHTDGTEDSSLGFIVRCCLAIALVAIGAWKHQPWLIAPAMFLASPVVFNFPALAILAAIPRLREKTAAKPGR